MVQEVSRREILTYAGVGAAGAGVIGVGSTLMSDNASATMQVESQDLEVSTPDGKVEEIRFHLEGEASYSNVNPEMKGFVFTTTINGEEVEQHSVHKTQMGAPETGFDIGPHSGAFPYDSGIDKPGGSGIPLFMFSSKTPSDYEVSEDGASQTFTFDIEVEFGVYTEEGSPDDPVVTTTGSDTVELTIINEEDGSNGGGGSGGSTPTPSPTPEPEASMSGVQISLTVELPNGDRVRSGPHFQ